MEGIVIEGPRLALRLSATEYAVVREVLAGAADLDIAIIGSPMEEVDRLARRFAKMPAFERKAEQLTLSRHELAVLSSVFLAATSIRWSPFSERTDVCEIGDALRDFIEQLSRFVPREDDWPTVH